MITTKILRSLTETELINLQLIANSDDLLWKTHMPESHMNQTALKEGRSIHIQMLDADLNNVEFLSQKNTFLDFYKIIFNLCNGKRLGRAYVHKLKPNTCIEKHNDNGTRYMTYVEKRMQMYLDIPENCTLLIDNKIQNIEDFKYKYIDFAWSNDHYYYNGSNKNWIFAVFDILK